MTDVSLYRNDGVNMHDSSDSLDDFPTGIAVLYADTGRQQIYSFFNARADKPFQGTAGYEYESADDAVATFVEQTRKAIDELDASVKPVGALSNAPEDPHWAFLSLCDDPLELDGLDRIKWLFQHQNADEPVPAQRRGVVGWLKSLWVGDQHSGTLDYAAPDYKTAARLFSTLFTELADCDVTIAVSKSGRTARLNDVDIVISVDTDSHALKLAKSDDEYLEHLANQRRRWQFEDEIDESLASIKKEYEELADDNSAIARNTLRNEFNSTFTSHWLQLESTLHLLRNYTLIAVGALLLGLVGGVQYGPSIKTSGSTLITQADELSAAAIDAVPAVSPLYAGLTLVLLVALPVLVVLRKRVQSTRNGYNSVEGDLLQHGMTMMILCTLGALAYSIVQLA